MPSGPKKRKAAKKKKIQQQTNTNYSTHSHGKDEVKHYDQKESDGGEVSSAASQYHHESKEDESRKREGSSSTEQIVPESNSTGEEAAQEVAVKEKGAVQTESELKLEDDYKVKNISIESTKEVHNEGSSSSSSTSSSDDAVDSVKSVEPVECLPEVLSQDMESDTIEENDNKVVETGPVDQVKLDDSLSSIVNPENDSIPARETDNGVVEAVQVVDLVEPTDCSSKVVYKVNDTVLIGDTRNGDIETVPVIESEKDSLIEETVEVTESALTVNPNTSCVVELEPQDVGEKKMLTLDKNNAVSPELVDLGWEREHPTTEKAEVSSDAKYSATEVQEDKLELSYNSSVRPTSNGAELVANYQNPEYSSNQPPVVSTSQTVQKTFMKSCCGIFEWFTSSDR